MWFYKLTLPTCTFITNARIDRATTTAPTISPAVILESVYRDVGTCDAPGLSFIHTLEGCSAAADALGLLDTVAPDISEGRSSAQLRNQGPGSRSGGFFVFFLVLLRGGPPGRNPAALQPQRLSR